MLKRAEKARALVNKIPGTNYLSFEIICSLSSHHSKGTSTLVDLVSFKVFNYLNFANSPKTNSLGDIHVTC